jgi:hypothetical protein
MKEYVDINGDVILAFQLQGPTLLNTIEGEKVGECGDWMLTLADGRTHILSDEIFINSFKIKVEN